MKVTSGSTAEVADFVDDFVCKSVIVAGTHLKQPIHAKLLKQSKAIENAQRDVNICLS
jgi:UDP-N-acetyl-D-mannosaminuronate dehydrogenase